jgi:crotonobetainyl-CoA:carnitine CoA-transferase CaiB-like acyl-CoA transferase
VQRPGKTWISITGYGRSGDAANWVAFGDDAAVSAGLSTLVSDADETPIFCGDAIGDPLAGMHAALAGWQRWQSGRGGLISIALGDVIGHVIDFGRLADADAAADRRRDWQALLDRTGVSAAAPRARAGFGAARPLGADTATILTEFGVRC